MTAILQRFIASLDQQYITIKAKFGKKYYTTGIVLHAKFGADQIGEGVDGRSLQSSKFRHIVF